ncbi:hypothetical protein D3C76_1493120 [compost metagenome]
MSAKPTRRVDETDSLNTNTLSNSMIVGPMYCTNPSVENAMRAAARAKKNSGSAVTTPERSSSMNMDGGSVHAIALPTEAK